MYALCYYDGNRNISKEKQKQFAKQMRAIFYYGGMMRLEEVHLCGKEITLLRPVEVDDSDRVVFVYNYFEDDAWDPVLFEETGSKLHSGNTGEAEFNHVMTAANMLYFLYDPDLGVVYHEKPVLRPEFYIGWLNQILGTDFTMEKHLNLWNYVEAIAKHESDLGGEFELTQEFLEHFLPLEEVYLDSTDIVDLADILTLVYKTKLVSSAVERFDNSYISALLKSFTLMQQVVKKLDGKHFVLDLIEKKKEERQDLSENPWIDESFSSLAKLSLSLPARSVLLSFCLALNNEKPEDDEKEPFWKLWLEVEDRVYHDEEKGIYKGNENPEEREKIRKTPCKKVWTTIFLLQAPFGFCVPDEIKDLPEYLISDDDRLYWWDGSDDVVISEETDAWLKDLAFEFEDLIPCVDHYDNEDFLKEFVSAIDMADEYYGRIMPFQTMFYEFIANSHKREYRAALDLFKKLSEEYKEEGSAMKYLTHDWYLTSRKITFNPARLKLKRFLAVMANKELRIMYFGF